MAPQAAPVQPLPVTLHVTDVSEVFLTVAVNCSVLPAMTCAVIGLIDIETPGRMVTAAEADFEESATEVAVTVTSAGEGTLEGAV